MKPASLNALLLDRELGELSAEAVELLDDWLAEHPQSAPPFRRSAERSRPPAPPSAASRNWRGRSRTQRRPGSGLLPFASRPVPGFA